VSRDHTGRECSPNEQHDDHERDAKRHGFTLHHDGYRDIGSASRHAKKGRDDFDRMIADLKNGGFQADGLALWEPSRGSRRVSEWALLVDLLAEAKLQVWISTHGRMYDPAKPRDRRSLLEDAVDSEYESGKTSDRLTRSHASRAAEGRAVGRVSYGYRRTHDEATGRPLGRVPEPAEAAVVVELFDRFAGGQALSAIGRDFTRRGLVNGRGKPFATMQLRDMLRNRVYIAERVHIPGKETRWWRVPPGEVSITPGQWEPIIDRAVFFTVQAILTDPRRVTMKPGGAKHLLSMTARCDVCSGPLRAGVRRGNRVYLCNRRGCVLVPQDDLDDIAEHRILAYLSSPAVYETLREQGVEAGEELARVDAALSEVRAELADLSARVSAGELTVAFAARTEPGIQARVAALEQRRVSLSTPAVLRGLVGPGTDVAARWKGLEVAQRREVVSVVLCPGLAGELRVIRSPKPGHRVPTADRVVFARRD
jgi:site-specific DNA recombinase